MNRAWMSSVRSNSAIGQKQGLRTKHFGQDWDPAEFIIPTASEKLLEAMNRSRRGYALRRDELPEAAAVWDEKSFQKTGQLFASGGIYVVKERLAEILAGFDLGDGGLVPFPIYQSDLKTPYPGEFFLLNFGAIKNTLLPEASPNVVKRGVHYKTGREIWEVKEYLEGQVALSPSALQGADLWVEELLESKIFMSDALAQTLMDAKLHNAWRLTPCSILESWA